ncbi:hypothetical protein [Arcicella sp. BE140]|uniref:hypothetical protein n=1 Tax=Arcicella sp. BE140 TaxID=2817847 RepID=UPI00286CD939|nr:hypothetical protein [Arcicella sp. BE140]
MNLKIKTPQKNIGRQNLIKPNLCCEASKITKTLDQRILSVETTHPDLANTYK